MQGENGGKNHICCLNKRSNLLHIFWEHPLKTSEGTEEAEHASYNSDFNETTVISGTEITIDLIITEKAKIQLLPFLLNPYSPSPFRTMTHKSNTEPSVTADPRSSLGHRLSLVCTTNTNLPSYSLAVGHLIHTDTCPHLGLLSIYSMLAVDHQEQSQPSCFYSVLVFKKIMMDQTKDFLVWCSVPSSSSKQMFKREGKQNLYPQEMALQIQKSVDQSFSEQEFRSL